MKTKLNVLWHSDCGHAWLEVDKDILKKLGISNKISRFSYENNGKAFLEEDCDAHIFFEYYFGQSEWFKNEQYLKIAQNIDEKNYSGEAPIRNYNEYKGV